MNPNVILAQLYHNACEKIDDNIKNLKNQKEIVKDIAVKNCIDFKIHGYEDSKKILQDEFVELCKKNIYEK